MKSNTKQAVEARQEARKDALNAELERLVELLRARPEVMRVALFGSLAAGNVGARSDLDLAVVARSSVDFPTSYEEYYCYLRPEVPLDLLVYTPHEWQHMLASSRLVQRIARDGGILYEAKAAGKEDGVETTARA